MAKAAGRGAVVLVMVGARIALALFRASSHSTPVAFNPNSFTPKFDTTTQIGSCLSIPLADDVTFDKEPVVCLATQRTDRITVRITSRKLPGVGCPNDLALVSETNSMDAWCYEPVV
jgi:hypothetical protein